MTETFTIRRHGARPHSLAHLEPSKRERQSDLERQAYQNGPVIVKARDGKFLPKPETIPAHQGAA